MLSVLYRTRLRLTCKTFSQRSVFYKVSLNLLSSSTHFVHHFFQRWSIDTTKLQFLNLIDCSLTARDQLALSSCTWNLSQIYIKNCNMGDYFFSLFLSKLNMSGHEYYDLLVYETLGLLSSYQLARLLKRFHTLHEDSGARFRLRWQEQTRPQVAYMYTEDDFRKWAYIYAAARELGLLNGGISQTRVTSEIDIAMGTEESVYSHYNNRPSRPPSIQFQWNHHVSTLYYHCSSVFAGFTFPDLGLTDMEPPILDHVNVCMRGNAKDTNRRMSPRLLCQ